VVEKIRGTRRRQGERQYLIQWQDWPEDYNTWQSEADCKHAPDLIKAFWEEKQAAQAAAAETTRRKGKRR